MRIREENRNMILLAAVTLICSAVACGATLVGPPDTRTAHLAGKLSAYDAPSADRRITRVSQEPPVRIVGAPFVPNTHPRDR